VYKYCELRNSSNFIYLDTIQKAPIRVLSVMKPQVLKNLRQTVTVLYQNLKLSKYEKYTGRPSKLSIIDALSLALYKQRRGSDTKKSVYDDFKKYLKCSYKTFVITLNKWASLAAKIILLIINKLRKQAHLIKHIDSTDTRDYESSV
jgi:hypothetical protein